MRIGLILFMGLLLFVPDLAAQAFSDSAAPRTLRAYWHVFIAFALVWLLLFGYVLSLGRRFGRLQDEIDQMDGEPSARA